MAITLINGLYPPVINTTYMPAFLVDSGDTVKDTCRVYFSISQYNSLEDIKNAQVTVVGQNSNISMLDPIKYPSEVMLKDIYTDENRADDKYYIEITKDDIVGEKFEINQYYKVQIRFTSVAAPDPESETKLDSWLSNQDNLKLFSEWSRACLIRGISTPILTIKGFDPEATSIVWASSDIDIIGKLEFKNIEETEILKSYNIKMYNEQKELIEDSGIIYASPYVDINQIYYTLKNSLQNGNQYSLEIEYTTANFYVDVLTFDFTIEEAGLEKLDCQIEAIPDSENGRIGLQIKGNTEDIFTDNFTIRRTSSESKFQIWEDVHTATLNGEPLNYLWSDCTVKSGVWYKYGVQRRNAIGERGIITVIESPQMIEFDHIFLNANNTQIKIKFNPQISNFKKTVLESRVDTLGGKYPFISRNGNTEYKQFTLSGLITHFMDRDKIFTSREELYGEDIVDLYDGYNSSVRKTPINDSIYERDFRDKVIEFLYANNIKLFRSPTEGNMLIKLMDISLTPEIQLGRHIYSFTCGAYEIAECNTKNYDLYEIQKIGTYKEPVSEYQTEHSGQISGLIKPEENIIDSLIRKYEDDIAEGYVNTKAYLDHVKIEVNQNPYPILESDNGPYAAAAISDETLLGTIVYINNEPIVIGMNNTYELSGESTQVESIETFNETDLTIDYHMVLEQAKVSTYSTRAKVVNYYSKVGQLEDTFEYGDYIYNKIKDKYEEENDTESQSLSWLNVLRIEADEGTVVYIQEQGEEAFDRHIIGPTCTFNLSNEENQIQNFYFSGIHLNEVDTIENITETSFYAVKTIIYSNLENILSPGDHCVYTLEDQSKWIWFNQNWYEFTETNDVKCAVYALIDYCCEIEKGMYEI